jgi:hypothetical protein
MTMAVRDLESSIFTTWDTDGEEERGGEEEGGRDRVEEGEREREEGEGGIKRRNE